MGLATTLIRSGMQYASTMQGIQSQERMLDKRLDVEEYGVNATTKNTAIKSLSDLVGSAAKVYAGYLIGKSKNNKDDDSNNKPLTPQQLKEKQKQEAIEKIWPSNKEGLLPSVRTTLPGYDSLPLLQKSNSTMRTLTKSLVTTSPFLAPAVLLI